MRTRIGIHVFLEASKPNGHAEISETAAGNRSVSTIIRNTGNTHVMVDSIEFRGFNQAGQVVFTPGWYVLASARGGTTRTADHDRYQSPFLHWRPLLARSLDTSYALVQVPNGGRVRIYANNQDVGRTNRWGDLLVTDLQPYHASTFTIRDEDIPVNYELNDTDLLAALPYRGAVLRFAGHEVRVPGTCGAAHRLRRAGLPPTARSSWTWMAGAWNRRLDPTAVSTWRTCRQAATRRRSSPKRNCEFEVRIPNTRQVLTDLDMIRCEPAGR